MAKKIFLAVLLPLCLFAAACGAGSNRVSRGGAIMNPYLTEKNGGFLAASTDKVVTSIASDTVRGEELPVLSKFTTDFDTKDSARKTNIQLASDAINGKIIYPGETFSFNETVGPTTKENGYKLAHIFIKGQKTKGYGGGVCQVSSALYNAADEAGLDIIERHPHSLPVTYVPEDRDAATSYGGIDFKFENSLLYPIKIISTADNGTVAIRIEKT